MHIGNSGPNNSSTIPPSHGGGPPEAVQPRFRRRLTSPPKISPVEPSTLIIDAAIRMDAFPKTEAGRPLIDETFNVEAVDEIAGPADLGVNDNSLHARTFLPFFWQQSQKDGGKSTRFNQPHKARDRALRISAIHSSLRLPCTSLPTRVEITRCSRSRERTKEEIVDCASCAFSVIWLTHIPTSSEKARRLIDISDM